MNEQLRDAIADCGLTRDQIASRLAVDPKTVDRWIAGRVPHPRHREALARLINANKQDLWPEPTQRTRRPNYGSPGIIATYPHRWAVPRTVWQDLFEGAEQEIDILAYAGLFLAEDTGLLNTIAKKAREGVTVRILLGDPDGHNIAERGEAEGIGDAMSAKIRNALTLYQPLRDIEGVHLRLHDTALYNSIYRSDNEIISNPHILGVPAAQAPVLHLRNQERLSIFAIYCESFKRIWSNSSA
ncbi:XRE family transcriptional regulator [Actinomadura rayongensis]|uniref:XRE family transcriptional regulator n=1 Tax=Actinomadura rayongensis TaxID=1429076 RepID=A0A6I4WNK1_9ACTN|nr:XRE family transcriptional regulator [Actinomadura rayongensis]MXQ68212.1 XRE family transcriptional regulator [Actinomadura rayongensis]